MCIFIAKMFDTIKTVNKQQKIGYFKMNYLKEFTFLRVLEKSYALKVRIRTKIGNM